MSEAPYRYTAQMADEIENRWQQRWLEDGTFHAVNPVGDLAATDGELPGEKSFIMDMFPYPSGRGLHVGHPLGYIATDVVARYQRMLGRNVLYTMGYDAFGLPAEQYAITTGTHPRATTEENVANMRRQLRRLGLSHDARRELATTDDEFVRWTQWIFLQLFESWYDPDAGNAGGVRGRARPISELRDGLLDGDVDPWRLAQRQGIELPEYWRGHEASSGPTVTDDDPPFDRLAQAEPRRLQELTDSFRLAYVSDTPVNWCPGLGTVLANEEVTPEGRSERGNFPVFERRLRQWNMRITAYADRLADDLERVDWPDSVKAMQRNWIGRSEGAEVTFRLAGEAQGAFSVFTTRPDTLFGATFAVLAPEHALLENASALPESWPEGTKESWMGGAASPREAVAAYRARAAAATEEERTAEDRTKTGVFTGLFALNPMDRRQVPVFTADYVLTGYGTGAIMAVPAEDQRDYEFAAAFDLPVLRTVLPPPDFEEGRAYTGPGEKINSAADGLDLNGMDVDRAKQVATEHAVAQGFGRARTTYRLRDWLFSRQRYWGEPFPIVYAEDDPDTPIALPAEHLPVPLPELENFSPRTFDPDDAHTEPQTPLSRNEDWVRVTLDLGEGPKQYRRETNTMPNWAGSSWYPLRYIDPHDDQQLVDPANEKYWMGPAGPGETGGVDLYVGGVEHAVLHLLYARFWHKVLFDLGYISSQEPFYKYFSQGYIQAYAYTDARGSYVPVEDVVEEPGGSFSYRGEPVAQEYGKMGKSLKNMVTPDDMYADYGADTFRVYEMSMGPLDLSRPWETRAVVGSQRFLQRLWRLAVDESTGQLTVAEGEADVPTKQAVHRTIDGVRRDMDALQFNTAIAKLIELVNRLTKDGVAPREAIEPLVLMTSPFAPHLAEELWSRLGHEGSLAREPFPVADPALVKADAVTCVVQIKGKVRHRIEVDAEIGEAELEQLVMSDPRVVQLIGDQQVRKVIVRAPKLVNIVV